MRILSTLLAIVLAACNTTQGTSPPPDGWANNAPTVVSQVVDRENTQLLSVEQGSLQAWIEVPKVGAEVGDYVLLGQGSARSDVEVPELGERVAQVVDIAHIQVVDEEIARRTVMAAAPADAVPIATVFAELTARDGQSVVVYGTVVKATSAAGSVWVHIQDGSGTEAAGDNDLTIQASESVTVGQRVAYQGVLKKDADIGFGYHFDALVEDAQRVE